MPEPIYEAEVDGIPTTTPHGNTSVCLFNFRSIYLGPVVRVHMSGNVPLVIMSRSMAYFDTPLVVPPGNLGVR
jgi:hypothetical protein